MLVRSTEELRASLLRADDSTIVLLPSARFALFGTPLAIPAGRRARIVGGEGEGARPTIDGRARSRLLEVRGTLELQGVHLTGGRASWGGCMRIWPGGSAIVRGSLLADCVAWAADGKARGGAVYVEGGHLELLQSTVDHCSVVGIGSHSAAGGALYCGDQSTMLIANTTIVNATALAAGDGNAYGGAMYSEDLDRKSVV